MNYYPHNIGDFAAETSGLSLAHLGAFIRLVDRFAATEKPIKTGWVSLGFSEKDVGFAKDVLEAFFLETPEGWIYQPMVETIKGFQEKAALARENGKKGGRPRKNNPDGSCEKPRKTDGVSVEKGEVNFKKLTNNQEPIVNTSPKGDEQHADLFADEQEEFDVLESDLEQEAQPVRKFVPLPVVLPDEWRKDAQKARPDIDVDDCWNYLRGRFGATTAKKTLKGWHKDWMGAVGRQYPKRQSRQQSQPGQFYKIPALQTYESTIPDDAEETGDF